MFVNIVEVHILDNFQLLFYDRMKRKYEIH